MSTNNNPESQISFQASKHASDDLLSTPYIPDPSCLGNNVPENIQSKRDHLFGCTVPDDRKKLMQVDDVSLYSLTRGDLAKRMTDIIAKDIGVSGVVTDATAAVGGNTLNFAQTFRKVNAVELSEQRARMLQNNVDVLNLSSRVNVVCSDYTKVMNTLEQDCVFFDPPWGGPEYLSQPSIDMFLGEHDVADLVVDLVGGTSAQKKPVLAKLVVIKAPVNYNVEGVRRKLNAAGRGATIAPVIHMHKMDLLLIRAAAQALAETTQLRKSLERNPSTNAVSSSRTSRVSRVAYVPKPPSSPTVPLESLPGAGQPRAVVAFEALRLQRRAGVNAHVASSLYLQFAVDSTAAYVSLQNKTGNGLPRRGVLSLGPRPNYFILTSVPKSAVEGTAEFNAQDGVWVRLHSASGAPVRASSNRRDLCLLAPGAVSDARATYFFLSQITSSKETNGFERTLGGSLQVHSHYGLPLVADAGNALRVIQKSHDNDGVLLFRPIFMHSFIDLCASPSSTGPKGDQALLRALGVPALQIGAVVAAGKRGKVFALTDASKPSWKGLLKTQPYDSRVEAEVRVIDLLSAIYSSEKSEKGSASPEQCWLLPSFMARDFTSTSKHSLAKDQLGTHYQVMEDGGLSLDHIQDKICGLQKSNNPLGRIDWKSTLVIMYKLASAIKPLHNAGMIYCDMHPGNVLLLPSDRVEEWNSSHPHFSFHKLQNSLQGLSILHESGELNFVPALARLIDWGSVQFLESKDGEGRETYSGPSRGGRWDFMPPEQFGPGEYGDGQVTLDVRSDIFALGATAISLLVGRPPFGPDRRGDRLSLLPCKNNELRTPAKLRRVIEFLPISPFVGPIPPTFVDVLLRAIQPNPDDRYQSVTELIADIYGILCNLESN